MIGEEKYTRKLAWMEVTSCIQNELERLLDRAYDCEAVPDDLSFWDIRFSGNGITIEDMYKLLHAVNADALLIRDSLPPTEDGSLYLGSLGMDLANRVLQLSLEIDWEHQLICHDGLCLIGITKQDMPANVPVLEIADMKLQLGQLKSRAELLSYLQENGATHSSLMDFCEEYRAQYHNELCWPCPISDGKHLGTFLIPVREGILSLPYDEADKEEYEIFCLEDAVMFHHAEEMENFIDDWHRFDIDLRQAMHGMRRFLQQQEVIDHGSKTKRNR